MARGEDGDLAACARRDVGELEGDEAAADHHDPPGELLELEEPIARDHVLLAGHPQLHGRGARSDEDVSGLQRPSVHVERVATAEGRAAMERLDPLFSESGLDDRRPRIGEAALEGHQAAPGDGGVPPDDALAFQAPDPVERLRSSDEDLLRVTAPQGAGAPVGPVVDDRDVPARGAALEGDDLGGRA